MIQYDKGDFSSAFSQIFKCSSLEELKKIGSLSADLINRDVYMSILDAFAKKINEEEQNGLPFVERLPASEFMREVQKAKIFKAKSQYEQDVMNNNLRRQWFGKDKKSKS